MKFTRHLLCLWLLLFGLLLLGSCKDGIVMNQPLDFPETVMTPRPKKPLPSKSPETPTEIITYQLEKSKEKVVPFLPLILGGLVALGLLYQLLRVIYDLTTSSPSV